MSRIEKKSRYGLLLLIGLLGGGLAVSGLRAAAAAEKVALVIGNGQYDHAPRLSNPERDAGAVAEALVGLGFRVTGPLPNLSKAQMDEALRQFGRQTRNAAAAVVYFSGHGMELGGQNYLIPKDAVLEREADVSLEAVGLNVVLDQISGASGYRLVILDACRDNPLANSMLRANGAKAAYRGLAPVEPAGQTYVAYAARAGQRSRDGEAGGHSPYAAALLNNLPRPGLPLERLFGAVRDEVKRATNGEQTPVLYGESSTEAIYLAGLGPVPDHDLTAWQSAERCGTAACFRAYLEDYPQGRYAKMARARLQPVPPAASAPAPAVPLPDMVRIAGGRFPMGSPESETGRDSDEKRHEVTVKDFEMGRHEVTVKEFRRFADATRYQTDAERDAKNGCYAWSAEGAKWDWRSGLSWRKPGYPQSDDHPVVCVSWNDANRYLEWLAKETGQPYRLPTEAEWEYAARAGTTTARYWGDDPDQACGYANVADQTLGRTPMHNCRDGYTYTAPVGTFAANGWGLKDMLGNVWEWTCSAYDHKYGGAEQECADKGTSAALTVRGCGWDNRPAWVRSANRYWGEPAIRGNALGFRLARSL
ncbi:MAG: SUMF1/EgtB/PvdO family nonheme iron enzyme [Albidovulum sp.]